MNVQTVLSRMISWKFFPFVVISVVWLVFSLPYIVSGTVPFPSDYQVNHFPPWSSYSGFAGPVKNNAMPDIIDQIYPWRSFSVDQMKNGSVPFWNPNNFSGNPHIGNFQSATFSPLNIFFFILPFLSAWSLIVLLQPFIAGVSFYIFMRENKVTVLGSLISSISFMFCGFIVVWMAYGTLALAISLLPLVLFCIQKYINSGKIIFGFLTSGVLTMSFFSGHFQTSLYVFAFASAYALFYTLFSKKTIRSVIIWGFIFFGVISAFIQLIPTIQFYLLSARNESYITGGGIPWNYLITLIAPDFYGNPVTRNDWFGYYAEWASFVGVIPLSLSFFSLFLFKNKSIRFFIVLVGILLFLTVSSPVQAFIGSLKIPVLSTSNPSRIVVLLSFSFAVLSGFGFDELMNRIKKKEKRVLFPLLGFGVAMMLIWITLFLTPFTPEQRSLAIRNFLLPSVLFVALGISITSALFLKKRYVYTVLFIAIVLMTSFDSLRFVTKWMPEGPSDNVFVDLKVIEEMQKHIGHGRVYGNIGAQVTTYYNLPGIEGYDPLYIDRYGQFVNASSDGLFHSSERSVVQASPRGKYINRLLDITGVRLIYHPISDTNQSWAYPVWDDHERFEQVYKDDVVELFHNNTAIPRGTLYYSYEVISDNREILARFYSEDFDFRNTLILESDPDIAVSHAVLSEGSSEFLIDEPQYLKFYVKSSTEGLLFLSDNYYPGWKAFVNGQEVEILRANYTFRAVKIPKGESTVEFRYRFTL